MNRRLTALLFLLLIPAAFAVDPLDLTFAVPVMAVVVIILLAIANMMAVAMSNPRLAAWAKAEVREFIAAIILIAIITGAFISSTGISEALTGEENYVEESQNIVDEWIGIYDNSFELAIKAATRVRASATYSPYMNIPLWYVSLSYSANPLGGASLLLISLNMAAQGLTNVTFLYEGVRALLLFLRITVPGVLLPLAFIVRLIPFTRKVGNTLIAASIAGIVFLPFSLILADSLHETINFPDPKIDDLDKLSADPWAMVVAEPLCESKAMRLIMTLGDQLFAFIVCAPLYLIPVVGPAIFAACYYVVGFVVYPIMQIVFRILMTVLLLAWTTTFLAGGAEDYAVDAFNQLYPFMKDVNNLVLMGYLDFVLIAIMTIGGAKALSSALGGEWYMAGIQRLV